MVKSCHQVGRHAQKSSLTIDLSEEEDLDDR